MSLAQVFNTSSIIILIPLVYALTTVLFVNLIYFLINFSQLLEAGLQLNDNVTRVVYLIMNDDSMNVYMCVMSGLRFAAI